METINSFFFEIERDVDNFFISLELLILEYSELQTFIEILYLTIKYLSILLSEEICAVLIEITEKVNQFIKTHNYLEQLSEFWIEIYIKYLIHCPGHFQTVYGYAYFIFFIRKNRYNFYNNTNRRIFQNIMFIKQIILSEFRGFNTKITWNFLVLHVHSYKKNLYESKIITKKFYNLSRYFTWKPIFKKTSYIGFSKLIKR